MKEILTKYGFVFNRKGCPCSGTPEYYLATIKGKRYEAMIVPKRNIYRINLHGTTIASGNGETLEHKIKEIINNLN